MNISGDVPESLCNKGSVAICLFKASFEMGGHFFRVLRCQAVALDKPPAMMCSNAYISGAPEWMR